MKEEVELTPQLEAVVTAEVCAGSTLKIVAAAGSGKSTALRLYAERRSLRRTLYLTFTKAEAAAKDADYKSRGLHHVTVSTLHACAFSATHDLHSGDVADELQLDAALLARLTSSSSVDWPAARRDAVRRTIECFLASDALEPGAHHVEAVGVDRVGLLVAAGAVWHAILDSVDGIRLSHDAYLKLCQVLPGRRAAAFGDADLVLLDEGHDCTEAQIALAAAPARAWGLVIVYDFNQRIYGWRWAATEAYMAALPAVAVCKLSRSWRFGPALSLLASQLLSGHREQVSIQGNLARNTAVYEVAALPFLRVCGVGSQLAVVARTRRSLFNTAIAGIISNSVERITLSGGVNAYSMFGTQDYLLDTYALYAGRARHDMLLPTEGAARFAKYGFARFREAARVGGWSHAIEACAVLYKTPSVVPASFR